MATISAIGDSDGQPGGAGIDQDCDVGIANENDPDGDGPRITIKRP